jgi:hypothetical protein
MPSPLSDVYCCVIRPFVRDPWIDKGEIIYQLNAANPSADFFQTFCVALPWVIY